MAGELGVFQLHKCVLSVICGAVGCPCRDPCVTCLRYLRTSQTNLDTCLWANGGNFRSWLTAGGVWIFRTHVRVSYICRYLNLVVSSSSKLDEVVHHRSRLMIFWFFLVFSVWSAVSGMGQHFVGLNYSHKNLQPCPDSRTWGQSAGSDKRWSFMYLLSMDTLVW